ncbi:Aste57867_5641 [Aphanomyces stellatus]|uniref:Aste57867_5641 protein n=1 Tax=Aphanomyces stellatus TaxID=120398 RepID=A0A485KES7_9STRA|nr:hypothetical protein As57867_005628 [Aphanomyces stellatus]VFT82687.1 Aste57867_5641 [Aphanomyces stellatus]
MRLTALAAAVLFSAFALLSIYLIVDSSQSNVNLTHYEVLHIPPTATPDEIAAAYRSLSLQVHPDKTQRMPAHAREASTRQFHRISEAYQTLSNEPTRRDYDIHLRMLQQAPPPRRHFWWRYVTSRLALLLTVTFWAQFLGGLACFTAFYEYGVRPVLLRWSGRQLNASIPSPQKEAELLEARHRLQTQYNEQVAHRRQRTRPS